MGQVVAEEEVGDEDAVLAARVRRGEDIGALEGLGREAEDVVDDEEGARGGGGAGGVAFHVVGEGEVVAFWLVVFGDGGGYVAAGFAVALGGFHGC